MYLTELYNFYQRMTASGDARMPPPGMSEENIAFKLVISSSGELKEVVSLCDSKGKPARLMVPAAVKRSVDVKANFLWDNTGYVLGVDSKGKPARTQKTFAAFKELHCEVAQQTKNPQLLAVAAFLQRWQPESFTTLHDHEALLDAQVAFWLEGDSQFLHLQPEVLRAWERLLEQGDEPFGTCLVTGDQNSISLTHPAIKGVPGAQSAGAALISFNCPAFTSYGKEQSANAPVSTMAARGYAAALNFLLRRENGQCLQLGDTRAVFWAERPSMAEDLMGMLLQMAQAELTEKAEEGETAPDREEGAAQDGQQVEKLHSFLRTLRKGQPVDHCLEELDADVRFFILGLAPNAARLAVRFWLTDSFGTLARRVAQHYAHCALEPRYGTEAEFPTMQQFLLAMAPQGKQENIPPMLAGQLAHAVFTGAPYPESLYRAVLQRLRADKHISYLRAALIAAYLRRNHNRSTLTMSLDAERTDAPYLLGRLFALLEKAQQDALGNVNSSIKDRYFNAASATPGHVFPVLLRLAQHHLGKAEYGRFTSGRIAEIIDHIGQFPRRLKLVEQGDFIIGYYHQSVANYAKKSATADGQ